MSGSVKPLLILHVYSRLFVVRYMFVQLPCTLSAKHAVCARSQGRHASQHLADQVEVFPLHQALHPQCCTVQADAAPDLPAGDGQSPKCDRFALDKEHVANLVCKLDPRILCTSKSSASRQELPEEDCSGYSYEEGGWCYQARHKETAFQQASRTSFAKADYNTPHAVQPSFSRAAVQTRKKGLLGDETDSRAGAPQSSELACLRPCLLLSTLFSCRRV